ncbi:MAG: chitinase [Crocinitomicaceae bacterium]|jgi:chitinase
MMKQSFLSLILLVIISFGSLAQSPCKEIVGYYPNWQWYDRAQLVNPQTIDYSKYSILNYAFFAPQPDGSINSTDAWADENLLLGQFDWANNVYFPNTSIVDLAHNNNVKILPSIGGWTLSTNFPSIAADPVKRTAFANACVALITQYNFDGVDIDWEYPGYPPHGGTPADYNNYTLFLQEVRTAIDAYGVSVGKPMLLTVAVGAAADRMDDVNWTAVEPLLDIINLMSYDFFGAWDAQSNHNSPLYPPTQGDQSFNIDVSVDRLVNTYNVNPNKITVGVAFYGRSSKTNGTPALFGSNNGSVDNVTYLADEGSPLYYNIMQNMNLFTYNWDALAEVPYLTGNGALNTFVSYDNEQSIGLKAEYIVDNNLRGAIIWEITGDYMETALGSGIIAGTPLADTLNNVFCNYIGGGTGPTVGIQSSSLVICAGESITLTANGADTYSWDTGATTQSITVSPTSTITYTVTGTDTNGTDDESITITVNPLPVIASGTVNNPSSCSGSDGSIQITGTGTGNVTWTGTSSGSALNVTLPYTISGLSAGGYSVDFNNGCASNLVSNSLSDPGAPTPPTISVNGSTTLCEGETTVLESSATGTIVWSTSETSNTIVINTTGSYSVTYTDGSGCSSTSAPIIVTVNPLPTVSLTTDAITCINFIASNLIGTPTGGSYSGSGVTGTTFDPLVAGVGTHALTYEYTDGNGCTNTGSTSITVDGCASLEEENVTEARIYPNPISDKLSIEMNGKFHFTITDIRGRIIVEDQATSQITLCTSKFETGIYFVNINNGGSAQQLRIMKQ